LSWRAVTAVALAWWWGCDHPSSLPLTEGEQGRIMKREAMVHMSNAKLTSAAVAAAPAPAAAPPAAE
jgi:hypothetical protein